MAKYVGFRQGKVHESHVVSEYYCGGCGFPVTDHDSFCPECGGAFRECDADDLESENAKLRELCADMLRTMKNTTGPYIQTNHYTLLTKVFRDGKPTNVMVSLTSLEERYEQRFHELGIEARDD